jgi:purine-binding chemotaxis protein CheW
LDDETVILGAMADSVQEVLDLAPEQIEPAPRAGVGFETEYLRGMGKNDRGFIMIVDVEKLFSQEEMAVSGGFAQSRAQEAQMDGMAC